MRVSYSGHAEASLLDRELDREWVERTLRWPEVVEPDPKLYERSGLYQSATDGCCAWYMHGKATVIA